MPYTDIFSLLVALLVLGIKIYRLRKHPQGHIAIQHFSGFAYFSGGDFIHTCEIRRSDRKTAIEVVRQHHKLDQCKGLTTLMTFHHNEYFRWRFEVKTSMTGLRERLATFAIQTTAKHT